MRAYESKLDESKPMLNSTMHRSKDVTLDKCNFSWVSIDTFRIKSQVGDVERASSWHSVVPLKEIDVGSVSVAELQITSDKPVQFLRIRKRGASTGPNIQQWREGEAPKDTPEAQVYVNNRADGERVASAIKRAAILCGALASPF